MYVFYLCINTHNCDNNNVRTCIASFKKNHKVAVQNQLVSLCHTEQIMLLNIFKLNQ